MKRLTKAGEISSLDINKLMEISDENQTGPNDAYYKLKAYEDLEERLSEIFGGDITLKELVDELEISLIEPGKKEPLHAKILTYEDAEEWEKHKKQKQKTISPRVHDKVKRNDKDENTEKHNDKR